MVLERNYSNPDVRITDALQIPHSWDDLKIVEIRLGEYEFGIEKTRCSSFLSFGFAGDDLDLSRLKLCSEELECAQYDVIFINMCWISDRFGCHVISRLFDRGFASAFNLFLKSLKPGGSIVGVFGCVADRISCPNSIIGRLMSMVQMMRAARKIRKIIKSEQMSSVREFGVIPSIGNPKVVFSFDPVLYRQYFMGLASGLTLISFRKFSKGFLKYIFLRFGLYRYFENSYLFFAKKQC